MTFLYRNKEQLEDKSLIRWRSGENEGELDKKEKERRKIHVIGERERSREKNEMTNELGKRFGKRKWKERKCAHIYLWVHNHFWMYEENNMSKNKKR